MLDIDTASRLWGLTDVALIADTPGSHVYRAKTADGKSVIAKLLKPRGMEELPGMDYLAWRAGHGAVDLLARKDNACLLEDAGTLTLEDHRLAAGEQAAIDVFADVLSALRGPSPHPPPAALTPLDRHFRALTERLSPVDPDHAADLLWAADLSRRLLSAQVDVTPLHGDLHHENIMSPNGRDWCVIDPHGLIGDRAYDVANFFGNPLGRPDITCDTDRTLSIARATAPVIGCSPSKILEYACAHAALSACWSLDDPGSEDDLKDGHDRLAFLKVVRGLLTYEAID